MGVTETVEWDWTQTRASDDAFERLREAVGMYRGAILAGEHQVLVVIVVAPLLAIACLTLAMVT